MKYPSIYFIFLLILFASCERTIDLQLNEVDPKVVVDGYIETGLPPYVLLSRTSGYFDPVSQATVVNDAISGAEVYVSDETDTVRLSEVKLNGVLQPGVYAAIDTASNLPLMIGIPGKTYHLLITTLQGEIITSAAKLQLPVLLDSVWFQLLEGNDSLGLAYGKLKDPDTLNNCYRWFAKRISKDQSFIAPLGSIFDDRFINGQRFDLLYNRGSIQNSTAQDDNNEEAGLFKTGDTIVVRFTSIGRGTYEFWRDAEQQLTNNGSPFAVPSNIKSNITGGIGLFSTYSPAYDTIFAQ